MTFTPPQPLGQFDKVTMHDAFEIFEGQESVKGVICQYGGQVEQQLAATPRVRWEPTNDHYHVVGGRRQFAIQPRGAGGTNKLSAVRSKHNREAGALLYLYAKDDQLTEQLISRVVLALEDTFCAEANCRFVGGGWNLARAQSASSERYALHIIVAIPMIRILPAANLASAPITTIPEVPQ